MDGPVAKGCRVHCDPAAMMDTFSTALRERDDKGRVGCIPRRYSTHGKGPHPDSANPDLQALLEESNSADIGAAIELPACERRLYPRERDESQPTPQPCGGRQVARANSHQDHALPL